MLHMISLVLLQNVVSRDFSKPKEPFFFLYASIPQIYITFFFKYYNNFAKKMLCSFLWACLNHHKHLLCEEGIFSPIS